MIEPFNFAKIPRIVFGPGKFDQATGIIETLGESVLLVTGGKSFKASEKWDKLIGSLDSSSIPHYHVAVEGEPSPKLVDEAVAEFRGQGIDAVMAVGGGSVVDAGKAISAMLPGGKSVVDYLEGVGTGAVHDGSKVPFVAVPTTSGTGSEATKNAVLSQIGPDGFKKSLRHDNFVPDIALIDPELTLSCPPGVTSACGMDAFAQLLESYVSTKASPMTDALALSGIEHVANCLGPACVEGTTNVDARTGMAYGALMSGITLANAGLGIVHGLASPVGGYFDIPHGVVCGTLIGEATAVTIKKLQDQHGPDHPALRKYAKAGALICGEEETDVTAACEALIKKIREWTNMLRMPLLGEYGVRASDFDKIIAGTGNKNNPIALDKTDIVKILRSSL